MLSTHGFVPLLLWSWSWLKLKDELAEAVRGRHISKVCELLEPHVASAERQAPVEDARSSIELLQPSWQVLRALELLK